MQEINRMKIDNSILFAQVCEMLDEGKDVVIEAKGCSMLPFIVGDRDSVMLRKCGWGEGDAVLFRLPGQKYVLHRVVSVDGDMVTMKGDGNLSGTEVCRQSDVLGKVVKVLKKGTREADVLSEGYRRRVRRWNSLPYMVRRVFLGIYRRIVL